MTTPTPEAIVYVFGNNVDGQAGIACGEEQIVSPLNMRDAASRSDNYLDSSRIARVVCNQKQIFAVTIDGTLLTAGDNEHNELGRSGKRSLLSRVDALEAFRVCDIAVGSCFFILALKDGRCVSWGKNDMGQLGLGSEKGGQSQRENRDRPKLANILSDAGGVVQICAGSQHVVALARNGSLYVWGANRQGQLGDGQINSCPVPKDLPQLRHRPIVSITCGESHTLAMTVGGNVYSWGENSQGQLGLGDTTRRLRPELIRSLRASRVSRIAAGKSHSAAISPSGLLFTFGSDFFGQLGLTPAAADSSVPKFTVTPQIVEKLRPSSSSDQARPVEVSCGAASTLVLLADGRCFSFGLGSSGQLGHGSKASLTVPTHVVLPGAEKVVNVSCGGPLSLTSFVFTEGIPLGRVSLPSVTLSSILAATRRYTSATESQKTAALNPLREIVARAFSSIAVLNGSFILEGSIATGSGLRVKLADIRCAYEALVETQSAEVLATLGRALMQMTEKLREVPTDDPENLSVFLITFENPLLLKPVNSYVALERIVSGILALPRLSRNQLFGWLKGYASEYFARIVKVVQGYLSYGFSNRANNIDPSPAVLVLDILWEINGGDVHSGAKIAPSGSSSGGYSSGSRIIPDEYFVNLDLLTHVNIAEERRKFLQAKRDNQNTKVFNFLNYPFLLSVTTKSSFLKADCREKMQYVAYNVANALNARLDCKIFLDTMNGELNLYRSTIPVGLHINLPSSFIENVVREYQQQVVSSGPASALPSADAVPVSIPSHSLELCIKVQRETMLHDLLTQIQDIASAARQQGISPIDILYLPLKSSFKGEDGIDAGGVSRELLTLSIKELLVTYKVLAPMGSDRLVWFANNNHNKANLKGGSSEPKPKKTKTIPVDAMSKLQQEIDSVFDEALTSGHLRDSAKGTSVLHSQPFPFKLSSLFYPKESEDDDDNVYNCEAEFALGLLYGFASYNDCLIDLPLPKALYKVLLKIDSLDKGDVTYDIDKDFDIEGILTLTDLWECDEDLAKGMQQLLEFNEGDIADVFGVEFCASANPLVSDATDESNSYVDLVKNGSSKVVDRSNRAVFVELFIQHALYKSVSRAALAFFRGLQVFFFCTKPTPFTSRRVPLISVFEHHMCSAPEMQELLCGSHDVGDISLLRLRTTYKGEYDDEHPVIQYLWDVLSELSIADIRKFLMFVTGSDRVPVGGLQKMNMVVQSTRPMSASLALPASHTCFNILDLPVTYESKKILQERLMFALEHAAVGFGLV
jgi:alpha-tubulin suppressor-like RCC1 family protein